MTLLEMKGISKGFPGVQALSKVDFDLRKGEVHALMGENGAGKSTLMKILSGIYTPDEGTILYEGNEVNIKNPKDAQDLGITIVHQELNMMNHLSLAQNIFIGREMMSGGLIDDNKMNEEAMQLFKRLNVHLDPKQKMGDLTVGHQQMCEIAKAISTDAKLIVFDEPTAALTDEEIQDLFRIIDDLRSKGIGIVYISHRMDEIGRISDRVTVLRDGTYVGTVNTADSSKDIIINMMVGRVIYEDPKEQSAVAENAGVVLSVKNLKAGKQVNDVSFDLKKGEILGFSGLMGAGRTEVARALFGADKIESGEIFVNGEKIEIKSPEDAVKAGIGYLSEDRKRYGVIVEKPISLNISLAALNKFVSGLFVNKSKEQDNGEDYMKKLSIKAPNVNQKVVKLSGGNQQKVVIAKWLTEDSQILIFDEPTRGIDIGAKAEIYDLMNTLVSQGKSIIMISSELTEVLRMSDRIVVMCEGKKTAEIAIEDATQEKIMHAATLISSH